MGEKILAPNANKLFLCLRIEKYRNNGYPAFFEYWMQLAKAEPRKNPEAPPLIVKPIDIELPNAKANGSTLLLGRVEISVERAQLIFGESPYTERKIERLPYTYCIPPSEIKTVELLKPAVMPLIKEDLKKSLGKQVTDDFLEKCLVETPFLA